MVNESMSDQEATIYQRAALMFRMSPVNAYGLDSPLLAREVGKVLADLWNEGSHEAAISLFDIVVSAAPHLFPLLCKLRKEDPQE